MSRPQGMSLIVKRITKITVSLIFLFGMYIVLHGHLSPGGGFAGGVIIALSFIHVVLAFGREVAVKRLSSVVVSLVESAGGLLFWGVALLGLAGGVYFLNVLPKGTPFNLLSSGSILVANIAIFMKVAAGLFAIFVALAAYRLPAGTPEEDKK